MEKENLNVEATTFGGIPHALEQTLTVQKAVSGDMRIVYCFTGDMRIVYCLVWPRMSWHTLLIKSSKQYI